MRIVLNGASGFLGKTFLDTIAERDGIEVLALTSRPEELKARFPENDNFTFTDRNTDHIWQDADLFINLAFPRTLKTIDIAPGLKYISDQLQLAVDSGAKAVINISSQSVYDPKRTTPADEDTVVDLADNYAVGKYASELLTNSLCRNIPHTNIRMSSLIGAGFNQRLINKFVMKVIGRENIQLKAGHQIYGFMDVRDAAEGLAAILESDPESWKEVYVLGCHNQYTITDLAVMATKVGADYGYRSKVISVPADDHFNSTLDPVRFESEFGWQAKRTLEDTVRSIFEDMRR